MTLFLATMEFQTEQQRLHGIAGGLELRFEDIDKENAIKSVGRWWRNRNKAIPDHFHRLCAYKLWIIVPQKVAPDGYLPPENGFNCYEWKIDGGRPLP